VIPPAAVELHKEITENNDRNRAYQTALPTQSLTNGSGSNYDFEKRAGDNSYYIWYKESEPNVADTQTMSYEYELLYQATKEAEYKSKLKIYVTTFILFFSIVLLLLIFSPVFYKVFFTPGGTDTEQLQEESGSTDEQPSAENQASLNVLKDNNSPSETNLPPVTTNTETVSSTQTSQQEQEQPRQQEPKQTEQNVQKMSNQLTTQQKPAEQQAPATQPNNINTEGLIKNGLGWLDEKNKVVYIQLESGKFTIQESAWDSETKAVKRAGTLESLIPGVKGSVVRADLGEKGIWYRVRFGEFSSIDEARAKASELRKGA
jgi:cytoskeletal protein RodZ